MKSTFFKFNRKRSLILSTVCVLFLMLAFGGCATQQTSELSTPSSGLTSETYVPVSSALASEAQVSTSSDSYDADALTDPSHAGDGMNSDIFTAIITSDLHFTSKGDGIIYPMTALTVELAETIANEIIDRHPDVFIMTGDNTNNGFANDEQALAQILRRIHDAGIEVILTTGNHDMYRSSVSQFQAAYDGLCSKESKDAASLSYSLTVKGLRILAMDDSSLTKGDHGELPADTLIWLKSELEKAKAEQLPVLFLSHFGVLPVGEAATLSSYSIQNAKLYEMLLNADVRLCFSGHRHSQNIENQEALYQVVSGMPAAYPHLMGFLSIEDGNADYYAEPIDFEQYGASDAIKELAFSEKNSPASYRAMIETYADTSSVPEEELAAMEEVFRLFMQTYASGTMALHQEEIKAMPACEPLIELLMNSNYGKWMKTVLETPMLPGNELHVKLK
ncbi:MAG: metallophosphoesterase [Lachnospiraceae bacterium]|nr:metallophosphoesterase [Lachnospiraceae bacterium]